jgi:hypothetical protein
VASASALFLAARYPGKFFRPEPYIIDAQVAEKLLDSAPPIGRQNEHKVLRHMTIRCPFDPIRLA